MLILGMDTSGKTASVAVYDSDNRIFLSEASIYTKEVVGGPKNIPAKDNPGKTKIIETSSFTKVVCNSKCPKYNTVDNG